MAMRKITVSLPEELYQIIEDNRKGRPFSTALCEIIRTGCSHTLDDITGMNQSYSDEITLLKEQVNALTARIDIMEQSRIPTRVIIPGMVARPSTREGRGLSRVKVSEGIIQMLQDLRERGIINRDIANAMGNHRSTFVSEILYGQVKTITKTGYDGLVTLWSSECRSGVPDKVL